MIDTIERLKKFFLLDASSYHIDSLTRCYLSYFDMIFDDSDSHCPNHTIHDTIEHNLIPPQYLVLPFRYT